MICRPGSGGGHLCLPAGLEPQALTGLLAGRFGVARTLVLDGFTDPAAGGVCRCGRLPWIPLPGRVVKRGVWACGDRWVAAGTAHDAAGGLRPVLVAAHRQVPEMPAAALKENENEGGAGAGWVQRLREITGWSRPCPAAGGGWGPVPSRAGTQLPGDCRRMAGTFGVGGFDGLPGPEPGAVDGASGRRAADLGGHGTQRICTAGGCRARTLTAGPWRSAPSTPMDTALACPAAQFVCRILLDAHRPDTPAHHVGTHWFMTYDDGRDPHPAAPGPPDTPPPRRRPRPPWGGWWRCRVVSGAVR
ncbi:hypothetical protein SAMN05216532_0193 [Streptomyces sp. 2231.1]|nr:hypothetical protein SAMN05216532_0193 [Streptomyces sp. 2231.1]